MQILKLKPHFSEKIWGSDKFNELGFEVNKSQKIGEAWIVSAHKSGQTKLLDNNQELASFFNENYKRFNYDNQTFPILTKIISANDNLSVQVHPNDAYAMHNNNDLGKPEAWYVLDCPVNAKIIYGHNYKDKQIFAKDLKNNKWDNILNYVNINKGDFIYVPTGKIHAITAGITVLEVQRSSDVTYRLYDYDRKDDKNMPRQLNIKESLDCIQFPDINNLILPNFNDEIFKSKEFSITHFFVKQEKNFTITSDMSCLQIIVLSGSGKINEMVFNKSEASIVIDYKAGDKINFKGDFEIILCWI